MELIEKFAEIFNEACELGGGHVLSISPLEDKGDSHRVTAASLYYDTQSKIKAALERPETEFLASPIMEVALKQLPYLYPLTMRDVLEDYDVVMSKAAKITMLRKDLRAEDAYAQWQEVADNILRFSQQFSTKVDVETLNDLADSSILLLDALSVPSKWMRHKLWRGQSSDAKPVILWNMPKFQSLADFCDCFRNVKAESCIAFAFIENCVSDAFDDFETWRTGRECELAWNNRKHGGNDTDGYRGECIVGIKRGDNVWALCERLGWETTPYRQHSFYQYGKRTSYMPYQICFPDAEVTTTALTVRGQTTWDTRSLFDEEQAIWIPAMLSAVERVFFHEPVDEAEDLTLSGKAIAVLSGAEKEVPALAICKQYAVPDAMHIPETVQSFATNTELLNTLHVTQEDLQGVPFSFSNMACIKESGLENRLWNRARTAVATIAERKWEQDYTDYEWAGQKKDDRSYYNPVPKEKHFFSWTYNQNCTANIDNILLALQDQNSRISQIAQVTVDGTPCEYDYYGMKKTSTYKTTIDDGRPWFDDFDPWFFFPSTIEGRRPAVSIKIKPETAHDLALLMGTDFATMDWRFRLWRRWKEEYHEPRKQQATDPVNNVKSPYDDKDLQISIAMSKSEYKKQLNPKR